MFYTSLQAVRCKLEEALCKQTGGKDSAAWSAGGILACCSPWKTRAFLLSHWPLFPIFTFFFPFATFLPSCALLGEHPQPSWDLAGTTALLKAKIKISLQDKGGGGRVGGTFSFYANDKASKSCRWALLVWILQLKNILFIVLKSMYIFLCELQSVHASITPFIYILCNFLLRQLQVNMLKAVFGSFSSQLLKRKRWHFSQFSAICWKQPPKAPTCTYSLKVSR